MPETVNLFGETEPYGPKVRDRSMELSMHNAKTAGVSAEVLASAKGDGVQHPLGAPPLDWWVIDDKRIGWVQVVDDDQGLYITWVIDEETHAN